MRKKIILLVLCVAGAVQAGLPLVPVTYYGALRDAYGYPYTQETEIWLMRGDVEVARYEINGLRSAGVNYQLELMMDSGGEPYVSYATQTGQILDIFVRNKGEFVAVSPVSQLTVPEAGKTLRLDLISGTDSDGDGLPDAWEQMLIDQSNGQLTSLEDVRPDDDFDGDGMSNLNEFLSGTFPFLGYDRLALDDLEQTENGRFVFTFLSISGFTYQVEETDDLQVGSWTDLPCALDETAELIPRRIVGDNGFKTVYFEKVDSKKFVRLTVK